MSCPALLSRLVDRERARPVDGSDVAGAAACTAEVARLRALVADPAGALGNGSVVLNYQMYDERFPVAGGRLAVARLDEDYCLSDVMPGCQLELVTCTLSEKVARETRGDPVPFVRKSADGAHFVGMTTLDAYWVVVYEDAAQRAKDMALVRARIEADGIARQEGPRAPGCSCIEGNPCTEGNKYHCKNWEMRFAIAKQHGWNGT